MGNYGLKDSSDKQNNMILKEVSVSGNICGEFVEIQKEEVYENKGINDIEAVYVFPIPDTSVITGFEANIGGKKLKAKVESKSKAQKLYEQALEKGENTLTLEQIEESTFRISLGRIMSSEKVVIRLSIMDQLEYEDNNLKLVIPKIIEPLYYKNLDNNDIQENEYDYDAYLNILVEPLTKISIDSPTHNIDVEWGENNLAKVKFAGDNNYFDKDFILELKEDNSTEASGMIYDYEEDDEQKGILYLRLKPELEGEEDETGKDYIFLLDVSESMDGEKLEQEKNALQLCIRNLSEVDTFNLIAFGGELNYFAENSIPLNDENLDKASKWIDSLKAGGEGKIFDAIKYGLSQDDAEDFSTILLFTDDQVENEDEILNYVRIHIKDNRIFTFGIDTSANSYFINKLAERGYGKSEFFYLDERIDDKILRQFNRINNLQVDITSIDWGTMAVEKTYPRTIDYLYDMEPFSIFAKVSGEVQGKVTIRGKVGNDDYVKTIDLDSLDLEENADLIQKVWSRKRIESIEERLKGERGTVAETMKNKVIEISKDYGIISYETSFIMIEQIEEPVLGMSINQVIPMYIPDETMNNIAERHMLQSSGLLYKAIKKDVNAQADAGKANYYSRENILKIIAKNQLVDGSFADSSSMGLTDKITTTLTVILAFTMGKDDINLYMNQISKSIKFIKKSLDENGDVFTDKLFVLTVVALNSVVKKAVFKDKLEGDISERIEKIECVLKENNLQKSLDLITQFEKNSFKTVISSIIDVEELEKLLEAKIKDANEKAVISRLAKLAILKVINK